MILRGRVTSVTETTTPDGGTVVSLTIEGQLSGWRRICQYEGSGHYALDRLAQKLIAERDDTSKRARLRRAQAALCACMNDREICEVPGLVFKVIVKAERIRVRVAKLDGEDWAQEL